VCFCVCVCVCVSGVLVFNLLSFNLPQSMVPIYFLYHTNQIFFFFFFGQYWGLNSGP
jgi:hypothetical protein